MTIDSRNVAKTDMTIDSIIDAINRMDLNYLEIVQKHVDDLIDWRYVDWPMSPSNLSMKLYVGKDRSMGSRIRSQEKIEYIIISCVCGSLGAARKAYSKEGDLQHFVVGRDGTVYCFVEPHLKAFHAGAKWNATSIGISLEGDVSYPYDEAQKKPLVDLINFLCVDEAQKQPLVNLINFLCAEFKSIKKRENVYGYNQIAERRAPGPLMFWDFLQKNGIAVDNKKPASRLNFNYITMPVRVPDGPPVPSTVVKITEQMRDTKVTDGNSVRVRKDQSVQPTVGKITKQMRDAKVTDG
eukprot:CAMPEP_0167769798 /NCGR_PEP_ID=MMETSP0110_2-20121227/17534_1 /TAXON_ID=629695 /ORGANISM="Gymnochlora sp., Strain CCMP2014" /LENGTH=295 /DNA_ID=CAMNT_0007658845 /DNA_START=633 /DNA_END=1517 /DNA_ORIENTATION=-